MTQGRNIKPLQWQVYKGTGGKHGAVQFNLQRPHFYQGKTRDFTGAKALDESGRLREGWRIREGAVFLEITSTKDKNVYDWDNKIIIALSVTDMSKILFTCMTGDECKIMHDPGAKSASQGVVKKYLTVTSPKGTKVGAMISATQDSSGKKRSHSVPLTGEELIVLRTLLQKAISEALAW
jgi:hypothetical protein